MATSKQLKPSKELLDKIDGIRERAIKDLKDNGPDPDKIVPSFVREIDDKVEIDIPLCSGIPLQSPRL